MEGLLYINIFETKGMEYLIIIGFLIILIPFWIIINKNTGVVDKIHKALGVINSRILRIPQGLFFSRNHTWAYLEKSGSAKIGLDDFLMQIVGDVKVSHLKSPGEKIWKGDTLAGIDQNGKGLRIFSPISGEIMKINPAITENPGILNSDPYGNGWVYTVRPSDWKAETNNYYLAAEATRWISNEINRFKDFLALSLAKHSPETEVVTFQEGGELRQNVLSELDGEIWKDFQDTFLN
nr:hypothetical protein [Bacteroidota bacterium]